MIKAIGIDKNRQPLVIVGLSIDDLTKLAMGLPFVIEGKDIMDAPMTLLIVSSLTDRHIRESLETAFGAMVRVVD